MKLELRGITKRFGSLVANDRIDLVVEPGEIHGLLGENGAGKSTLMNVLYGLYEPDEGEILLDDVPVRFSGPGDAMAAGIGMVHQHFMLIPVFTVAENVMLGNEQTKSGGRLDLEAARSKVGEIAARFGFHVDPDAVVEDLPVGVQQRVEIIKALSREAQVLVFDEPTAVLTPQETDEFMAIMRQLRDSGAAIVFITHKLREVREAADRMTVVRRGRIVGEAQPGASVAEYAGYLNSNAGVPFGLPAGAVTCGTLQAVLAAVGAGAGGAGYSASGGVLDILKGNEMPNTPKITLALGVQYTFHLGGDYTVVPRFDYYWNGKAYGTIYNDPADKMKSYDVMNAQIQLNAPDSLWYARAWVQNIQNKTNVTGMYVTDPSSALFTNLFVGDPRTYGLTLGVHF